jgi:hypothetical protein
VRLPESTEDRWATLICPHGNAGAKLLVLLEITGRSYCIAHHRRSAMLIPFGRGVRPP